MAPTSLFNTLWRSPSCQYVMEMFCISIANLRNKHRLHKSIAMMLLIASISQINAQNSSSYFECNDVQECNHDLYCIDGHDCVITCNGSSSCRYGAIHPPNRTGNLTVTCSGSDACRDMTIIAPINDSFTLFCGGDSACTDVNAMCPIFGECVVDIFSHHSQINAMTVDASNMISGSLSVIEIPKSVIKCPGNNLECIADCTDVSCTGTSFHTQNDSLLRVSASGASSLQSVAVYCARHANCAINVTQPVSDSLSHFKLYSIDAMDGISFICDYVTDVSECYNLKDPPQLWCKSQYDTGCSLVHNARNDSMNPWQCESMSISELCTNNKTLPGYYGSQIVCSYTSECSHDLYCIDGQDCVITCSGSNSCRYGAIHPPISAGNLTVTCSSNNACQYMTIPGPINGSFTLLCGGASYAGCRSNVNVICPIFGECIVDIFSHHSSSVVTVNASNMISGSLSVFAIQNSVINCPGNNLECITDCFDVPCTGTSFHTQNDSIVRILASGASSLQSVTVYCALHANCSINVTQPVSDSLSHFKLYSIDAMDGILFICDYVTDVSECYNWKDPPQLWCKSQYDTGCSLVHNARNDSMNPWQCESMSISELCTNNNTLPGYYGSQIVCSDFNECSHDLYCIDGHDCVITCSGHTSCSYGAIHPPISAGNLTVTCSDSNACQHMTIPGPINGSFTLLCGGASYAGCRSNVNVICPIFGECVVDIFSHHSSNVVTVNANNMISGSLSVFEIQNSVIECPGNNLECIADCFDVPCTGTSFHTQNDSIVRIVASGASSLQSVTVYCALHANCSINVTQPVSDSLSHFKLYSIDAMDGISFICDYVTDVSECYNWKDPPQLWCKSQYDTGCSLVHNARNDSMNPWQCESMSISELCTNNNTLPGYYGSQIVCSYTSECSHDLYCIDGQDCVITCSGNSGCRYGAIHPPISAGNLTVTCSDSNACRDMTIPGPINGSFTLLCGGASYAGCRSNVNVICPIFGECVVDIFSHHSSNVVTVNANNMIYGSLSVFEIQNSVINCPGNNLECIADCTDVSCTGTSFHTQNDSLLRVSASGVSSLQSVNLYCALNANCSIIVDCGAQRSAICDIESQTGPSYEQWQCKGSKYPIVNFTDICRTHDPTMDPTIDPTIGPTSDPTIDPTANPSADLYTTLLSSWTETSITIVCACYFDEDKIDTINNIIIAYLDEDARIAGTKITTNVVSVLIAHADSNTLDHDLISRDIEVELKDKYDVDVDVTFDDTGDDEDQKRQTNIIQFLLSLFSKDVVIGIMIGFLVFVFVLIIGCICFCFHKRRKKRAKIQEIMVVKQQTDTQTKEHVQGNSMDVDGIYTGNDDGNAGDDTDEDLYDPGVDNVDGGNAKGLTLGNTIA